ncbi:DUF3857 domain-containing transglutaminase family protein [Silvibacterium bohemicum]|nr:DUF3857 and transglutaminase domain-containing protein [Silvibacterium bohemicum]
MTSDSAAPDAPAVYLFREETVADDLHMHSMYARIKILTEKGKEMFSDIEIPYEGTNFSITDISGRTIHADGTVVPFTGKPMDKLVVKTAQFKAMEKVFSMPDVQVGSIIEYRWKLRYDDNYYSSPRWYIQQPVFVHKAHYHFQPTKTSRMLVSKDEHGHEQVAAGLSYTYSLPAGVNVRSGVDGYDLTVENVSGLPDEDYMPPFGSFSYRVIFYYSPWRTSDEFWKTEGKYWSKEVDRFSNSSSKMHVVAQQLTAPGDNDRQKVEKIYAAVMKLENTSFTRTHSSAENKAEGLKVKSADDIWDQKRGSDDEIARLFIALCRAAGLKAYAMIVVNRDRDILQQGYFDWNQLNDELAIVSVGGKELFFDPGQRYCEFGKLHWKHTMVSGVRQTDNGTQIAATPGLTYQDTRTDRFAQLTLDPTGQVSGIIRITMTGTEALHWRQAALRSDEAEVKKDFEDELQKTVPPGVEVKTNHFVGLEDYVNVLFVQVDVSGSLGTVTGKRVFFPAVFFEAGVGPRFASGKRENPVDLHHPYSVHDQFNLTLPPGMTVESLPSEATVPFSPHGDYVAKYVAKDNLYAYGRLLRLASPFYKTDEYPQLRSFYEKTNTDDHVQVVLKMAAAEASPKATAGNSR